MKTINFKCPKCGHEWKESFSDNSIINPMKKCPKCLKYSENCIKVNSAWAEMLKKTGKKIELEK